MNCLRKKCNIILMNESIDLYALQWNDGTILTKEINTASSYEIELLSLAVQRILKSNFQYLMRFNLFKYWKFKVIRVICGRFSIKVLVWRLFMLFEKKNNFAYLSEQISDTKNGIEMQSAPPTNPHSKRDTYNQYAFFANIMKIQLIWNCLFKV